MRGILVLIIALSTFIVVTFLLWRNRTRNISQVPAYLDSYWDILKEKRRFIRFKKRLAVTCTISERADNVHHVFSKDIAGDGLCLQVTEILPEKSRLELKVYLEDSVKPMLVKGEVVWVKESQTEKQAGARLFDTGIKLLSINAEDRKRLDNFLTASHTSQQDNKEYEEGVNKA